MYSMCYVAQSVYLLSRKPPATYYHDLLLGLMCVDDVKHRDYSGILNHSSETSSPYQLGFMHPHPQEAIFCGALSN